MSAGRHNSAHQHPPGTTRGTQLGSKLGARLTLGRLQELLDAKPGDPPQPGPSPHGPSCQCIGCRAARRPPKPARPTPPKR